MARKNLVVEAIVVVVVAVLAVQAYWSGDSIRKMLLPALERQAEAIADALSAQVELALSYDIPLEELRGTRAALHDALAAAPELSYAALLTVEGRVLAAVDNEGETMRGLPDPGVIRPVVAPVSKDGEKVGEIVVGMPRSLVRQLVETVWINAAVLLLTSILITVELVLFVFRRLAAPPRSPSSDPAAASAARADTRLARRHGILKAAARAADDRTAFRRLSAHDRAVRPMAAMPLSHRLLLVRGPLFLIFFSESLTRPFLPAYSEALSEPVLGFSSQELASLPIAVFMAVMAISLLSLNPVTERLGRERALRAGAIVLLLGYVGTALADGLGILLVFRAVTALGYGLVFVAAQGLIIDDTTTANRAQGMSALVLAIMIAAVCGPSIGGLLADRIGVPLTFIVAAGIAFAAYVMIWIGLQRREDGRDGRSLAPDLRVLATFVRRIPLLILVLGCAIPAKLALIGVGYYAVPLYLSQQGIDAAAIGRVLMLYAIPQLLFTTFAARISDMRGNHGWFVVAGGTIAGAGLGVIWAFPGLYGSAAGMILLGIGQSLSLTPQSAMVGVYGRLYAPGVASGDLYGAFRFLERIGNAAGPIVVALMWGALGFTTTMLVFAMVLVVGAATFALSLLVTYRGDYGEMAEGGAGR